MHGSRETNYLPRTVWTIAHFLIVLTVVWVYFGNGSSFAEYWVQDRQQAGDFGRRLMLSAFAVTLFVRMSYTAFVLLKRKFDWNECVAVIGAVAFYQFGFAFLGVTANAPLGVVDGLAVVLFVLGSFFNTGAEIQRKRFKEDPANKGKLYTRGLFKIVRHPNYLGDVLWALGWALMTRSVWALLIPFVAAIAFAFVFIPQLTAYLAERYRDQFDDWAKKTKRLIPYVY